MRDVLRMLDQLLRGGYTDRDSLEAGRFDVSVRKLVIAGALLGAVYGVFMGLYAVLRASSGGLWQMLASALKVPLLFLLTLLVT